LAENLEAGENGGQSVSSKIMQTITIEQIESKINDSQRKVSGLSFHFIASRNNYLRIRVKRFLLIQAFLPKKCCRIFVFLNLIISK
jgi:hypothetical protein